MLYLCATPIGNLEDITLRVLRVLSEADAIYAEDTRHSSLLLNHYEIKKPLISCHEHNEAARGAEVVERLKRGENICYISDAGMPCISDPGARLIAACIEAGQQFTILPGASASVTALALSGLANDRFMFFGFLARSGKERKQGLEQIANSTVTTIVYESPNRVYDTLLELSALTGDDRQVALVREITKMYEEVARGSMAELISRYESSAPKGECVIVVSGKETEEVTESKVDEMLIDCLNRGMKAKEAAKTVAEMLGVSKNDAYKRVLELNEDR